MNIMGTYNDNHFDIKQNVMNSPHEQILYHHKPWPCRTIQEHVSVESTFSNFSCCYVYFEISDSNRNKGFWMIFQRAMGLDNEKHNCELVFGLI